MRKKITAVLLSLSVIVSALPCAFAAADDTTGSDEKVTVIVELKGDAVLESDEAKELGAADYVLTEEAQSAAAELSEKQDAVMDEILDIYPDAEKRFSYTHTLNGFSVIVRESDIERIKKISGVKSVTESQTREYTEPDDSDELSAMEEQEELDLLSCCEEIGADYMHKNGYSGEGRVVAIIDSEFDVNHEIFSGEITNPKYSKSDIKELMSSTSLNITADGNRVWRSDKIPFAYNYADGNAEVYNYDNGTVHGTHVAGIAAGNYGTEPDNTKFESVAPDAQLILMKVTSQKTGSLSEDAIAAATEDAAKLGVDAINMSFSTNAGYTLDFEKQSNIAAEAGIIISAGSGNANRGYNWNYIYPENVDYAADGSPNHAKYATSVASSNTEKVWTKRNVMITADSENICFCNGKTDTLFSDKFSDKQYEYVYCGSGTDGEYTADIDVTGKIVLIDRGGQFAETLPAALNHGALGVIIINKEGQDLVEAKLSVTNIPVCFISNSDGKILKAAENQSIQVSGDMKDVLVNTTSPGMSYYTSWGTSHDLALKPEITTPGGNVYSSVPNDEYKNDSGTSMATPHLTGAAALMYQYIDENYSGKYADVGKRALAENLMMSGASIIYADADSGIAESPRLQGAGLLNLENAATTPVYLVGKDSDGKSKITLGELGENRTFTLSFTARNLTDSDVTYNNISFLCQTDGTQEVNGTTYIGDTIKLAAVSDDIPTSVTVPAGEETEVSFEVTLDEEQVTENLETFTNGFWVDGFVILSSDSEGVPEISIPYTGFYGDWTKAPLWDVPYYSGNSLTGNTLLTDKAGDYILGQNQIAIKSGNYTEEQLKEYESEDYAGISPNNDGVCDTVKIRAFLNRAIQADSLRIYSVKDGETDKEVYSKTYSNTEIYRFKSISYTPTVSGWEDGDYRAVVSGVFAYDGTTEDSVEMNFYIDTEKPKILSRSIDTDDSGNSILNMTLSDNRYLMGVIVEGTDADGNAAKIYEPINALKETDVSIDVTGIENPTISVYDYAYNTLTVCDSDALEFAPTGSITKSDGSVTIKTQTTNRSGVGQAVTLIAAVYDENGVLKCMETVNDSALNVGETIYSFTLKTAYNPNYTVKLFAWNSLDDMTPLITSSEYKMNDLKTDISGYTDISIVHTNDIHGYYKSTKSVIGFEKLKTLINDCDADLVLDAGDTFHGQSFATVEEGKSIAELMNAVGYDAMSPGNHDWSYGADKLKSLESEDGFKIIASNVTNNSDGSEYFDDSYLVKDIKAENGETVRVGVIGVIDDEFYDSTASENVSGVTFNEETAAASDAAKTLRDDEDCDIVVAVTHQHDCEEFVSGISGIDAVIAGHEHKVIDETYTDSDGKSVPVYEAGYYLGDVGCVDIVYDTNTDSIVSTSDKIYTVSDTADTAANEAVSAKITEIEERENTVLNEVIGTSDTEYPYSWEDVRIAEQPIGRIVTAAYLDKTGADIAFENAGGIRGGIPKGDITYGNLLSISPYGNTLVTKQLTGEQILDILETSIDIGINCDAVYTKQKEALANGEDPYQYSWPSNSGSYLQFGGITAEYDASAEKGSRVLFAKINGEDIDETKTYTAAMNNYVAESSLYSACADAEIETEYGSCEAAIRNYIQEGTFDTAAQTEGVVPSAQGASES